MKLPPPNPTVLKRAARIRKAAHRAKKLRGNIPNAIIATEADVNSGAVQRFLAGEGDNHTNETLDKLEAWTEANKDATAPSPEAVRAELGDKLRRAYELCKDKMNSEEMALKAGVNRTVFSQLMNGTYTRALRHNTVNLINAWVDSVLK